MWLLLIIGTMPLEKKPFLASEVMLFTVLVLLVFRFIPIKDPDTVTDILYKLGDLPLCLDRENAFSWFYASLKEILGDIHPLLLDFNLDSFAVFLRNARCHLAPHWFCSRCGRQLRYAFITLEGVLIDPVLENGAGWLQSATVSCENCSPYLRYLNQQESFHVG